MASRSEAVAAGGVCAVGAEGFAEGELPRGAEVVELAGLLAKTKKAGEAHGEPQAATR